MAHHMEDKAPMSYLLNGLCYEVQVTFAELIEAWLGWEVPESQNQGQKPSPKNPPQTRHACARTSRGAAGRAARPGGRGLPRPPPPSRQPGAAEAATPRQPPLGSQVSCNFCAAPPIYWLIPPPSSFPLPPSPFPPFSPSLVAYRGRSISSLRETEVGSLND